MQIYTLFITFALQLNKIKTMLQFIKKYRISLLTIIAILFLSFFKPPKSSMSSISYFDKIVHYTLYLLFCSIIWIEYLRSHSTINRTRVVLGAFFAPIIFSASIELGQEYLTTYRGGEWLDLLANSLGSTTAFLVFGGILLYRVRNKR